MSETNGVHGRAGVRNNSRANCLREISVTYEGQSERTLVKAPDLSENGMFISTSRHFPEGAILNVQFRMTFTNVVVQTRCEVRYCLPGVGIGVEFVGLAPEAKRHIEQELRLALGVRPSSGRGRKKAPKRRGGRRNQRARR